MKDFLKACAALGSVVGCFIGFMLIFAWIESMLTGKWYEPFVAFAMFIGGFVLTNLLEQKRTCKCCEKK